MSTAWAGEPPEDETPPAVAMQEPVIHDEKIAEPLLDEAPPPKILPNNPKDHSKIDDDVPAKLALTPKIKDCCGYPIGLKESFRLSFYWVAYETEYASLPYDTDIYTKQGYFIGRFPSAFVFELKLEGSGILNDGRILNYDGECNYGMGTCFKTLDASEHPLGAGVQQRKLVPFRSIAVDPRYIPIGATVYVPELVGVDLPDGTKHDGCLRADDMGGAIKQHKLDFFVESYNNFKFIADNMWWHLKATPMLDEPRCQYLRARDAAVAMRERTNDHTDWAILHMRALQSKLADKARSSMAKMKRNRAKAQAWIKRHYGLQKSGKTQVAKRP
jgi:3D (Asp-Asp-Asp) domain-containing protein